MWIEQVEVAGFGPLIEEQLLLGEGMTLVHGPNEAGKSSWSAALYAGLCGIRRGRGAKRSADEQFERQHKPWAGGPWRVRTIIALSDGRRLELEHDLGARTGSARDAVLGRDVTAQILIEQNPDASVLLGLDRAAFKAVAWVAQGAMLEVRTDREAISEHLQRAAASAEIEATAAEAISLIDRYVTERIGTERAPTKPLARAISALKAATATLGESRAAHEELGRTRAELRSARDSASAAERRFALLDAILARRRAEAARDRFEEAAKLQERFVEQPRRPSADDALAAQVSEALGSWRGCPEPVELDGPGAAQLETELESLPAVPPGDREPADEVEAAAAAERAARASLESLASLEPAESEMPGFLSPYRPDLDPAELRSLADVVEERLPLDDLELERRMTALSAAGSGAPRHRAAPAWLVCVVLACLLALAGVVIGATTHYGSGWVLAAVGAGIALVLVASRLGARSGAAGDEEAHREDEAELVALVARTKEARKRHGIALSRLGELGLPPEGRALRDGATALERADFTARRRSDWDRRRVEAGVELDRALATLREALLARGVQPSDDLSSDVRRYREECSARARLAGEATRREDLVARLEARRRAEDGAAEIARLRAASENALRDAARRCEVIGAETATAGELADGLCAWLEQRAASVEERELATRDYEHLRELLSGRELDDLCREAARLGEVADDLAKGFGEGELDDVELVEPSGDGEAKLRALGHEASERSTEHSRLEERLSQQSRGSLAVPEAEERFAAAEAEVALLQKRARVLRTAKDFLARAQDDVHRSIAPQLAAAVEPLLSEVTGERYTEITVDPESLEVYVRAPRGTWRTAALLSQGTAEQIYLLLRSALVSYLGAGTEPCPLFLDDPTAHADPRRTAAVLEVLHRLSAERQIVVFTHDDRLLAWASVNLDAARDRIVELPGAMPA